MFNETFLWLSLFEKQNSDMVTIIVLLFLLLCGFTTSIILETFISNKSNKNVIKLLTIAFCVIFILIGKNMFNAKLEQSYNQRFNDITLFEKFEKTNYQLFSDKELQCKKQFNETNNKENHIFKEFMINCIK